MITTAVHRRIARHAILTKLALFPVTMVYNSGIDKESTVKNTKHPSMLETENSAHDIFQEPQRTKQKNLQKSSHDPNGSSTGIPHSNS
jgi:hypothetical protein